MTDLRWPHPGRAYKGRLHQAPTENSWTELTFLQLIKSQVMNIRETLELSVQRLADLSSAGKWVTSDPWAFQHHQWVSEEPSLHYKHRCLITCAAFFITKGSNADMLGESTAKQVKPAHCSMSQSTVSGPDGCCNCNSIGPYWATKVSCIGGHKQPFLTARNLESLFSLGLHCGYWTQKHTTKNMSESEVPT